MPFVAIAGNDVYYEILGSGPPVVLTSGGLAPAGSMLPLARALSADHTVLLWDRANQGMSHVVVEGDSELDLYADQLSGLLRALSLAPAVLAGPSEGSRISLRAALRQPDVVRRVFVWQVSAGDIAGSLRRLYHEPYARLAEEEGMAAVARTARYFDRARYNPDNLGRLLGMDPGKFAAVLRRWSAELREEDVVLCHPEEVLSRFPAELWVVGGVGDAHPYDRSGRLAACVPGARFIEPPFSLDDYERCRVTRDGPTPAEMPLYASLPGIAELVAACAAG